MSKLSVCLRRINKLLSKKQFKPSIITVNYSKNVSRCDNLKHVLIGQSSRCLHNVHLNCWKCGKERKLVSDIFCDKCNIVQNPLESKNYFRVFDLEDNFDLDPKDLTKRFRKLQSILHPDKFSNKSEEEKKISEEYSSLLNKAYGTLQVPLQRAIHLLALNNENIDDSTVSPDKAFLMEIMELNEEIEDADTPDKLQELNAKNKRILDGIIKEISECFAGKNITGAKESVIRMKYYDSINSRINNLLRERGISD